MESEGVKRMTAVGGGGGNKWIYLGHIVVTHKEKMQFKFEFQAATEIFINRKSSKTTLSKSFLKTAWSPTGACPHFPVAPDIVLLAHSHSFSLGSQSWYNLRAGKVFSLSNTLLPLKPSLYGCPEGEVTRPDQTEARSPSQSSDFLGHSEP